VLGAIGIIQLVKKIQTRHINFQKNQSHFAEFQKRGEKANIDDDRKLSKMFDYIRI
jgi:hypothetical protein